jgi:hydroxymethylbilane synthase
MNLRIGSRGSALALWQAEHVRSRLNALDPTLEISIQIIQTSGDKITDVALSKIGDKGLFTKELDRAIVDNQVDLAVHS